VPWPNGKRSAPAMAAEQLIAAVVDALQALDAAGIDVDLDHGAVVLDTGFIVRGPRNRWVWREKVDLRGQ